MKQCDENGIKDVVHYKKKLGLQHKKMYFLTKKIR